MIHSISTEGFGIRHRPVKMEDAPFLVWLRNLDHAKGKVGDSATDVAGQEAWLQAYFQRENDYYFIIETTCGIPVGAWGVYNISENSAEIGRWILQSQTPAAVPSIVLGLDITFDGLGLRTLRNRVVSINQRAIKLYEHVGFQETRLEKSAQIINQEPVDLLHMVMKEEDWPRIRKRLLPIALMLEVQVRKWERNADRAPHLSGILKSTPPCSIPSP